MSSLQEPFTTAPPSPGSPYPASSLTLIFTYGVSNIRFQTEQTLSPQPALPLNQDQAFANLNSRLDGIKDRLNRRSTDIQSPYPTHFPAQPGLDEFAGDRDRFLAPDHLELMHTERRRLRFVAKTFQWGCAQVVRALDEEEEWLQEAAGAEHLEEGEGEAGGYGRGEAEGGEGYGEDGEEGEGGQGGEAGREGGRGEGEEEDEEEDEWVRAGYEEDLEGETEVEEEEEEEEEEEGEGEDEAEAGDCDVGIGGQEQQEQPTWDGHGEGAVGEGIWW